MSSPCNIFRASSPSTCGTTMCAPDGQQRRDENKKPRSASVGSSLTPTKPRAALEQKQQNKIPLCSNRGVAGKVAIGLVDAGEGEAGALPPRSPVNKAPKTANNNNTRPNKQQQPPQQGMKVQGPTLEDALDDVQVIALQYYPVSSPVKTVPQVHHSTSVLTARPWHLLVP